MARVMIEEWGRLGGKLQGLRLHSGFDHIQGEDARPSSDTCDSTAEQNLWGLMVK